MLLPLPSALQISRHAGSEDDKFRAVRARRAVAAAANPERQRRFEERSERRRSSLSELSAEKSERRGELLEAFTAGEDSHGTCLKDRPKRESTRKKAAPVPRMNIQRGNEWGHLRAGGCAAAVAIGSQKCVAPHSLPPPGPTDVTI